VGEPVVVMVHGLRGTHHGLEPIVARLPGCSVVVPDLPGFGDSSPMTRHRHDAAGYAACVRELIERLVPTRPVALLGHSFGSVIAARVAAGPPGAVRRLVLVNPIAAAPSQGPHALLVRLTSGYYWLGKTLPPRWGTALLSNRWVVRGMSEAMVRTKDKGLRRFVHDSHLRYFSRFHSPAVLCESYESSLRDTVCDFAASLTMPALLIAGETDDIVPMTAQRALASRLADAELVVLPEVGHLIHYETPDAAGRAIQRFLGTA
jgi:pimeloyl-ACP methyl ester carboxylesterase